MTTGINTYEYWEIFTVSSYVLIHLILLRDIYSIINLTLIKEGLILLRDIYSIIVCHRYQCIQWYCKYPSLRPKVSIHTMILIDTCGLTEGYLQYHRMYWYLWSYWGIFTVSLYALIPVFLMRDIYSIIVCIDTCVLNEGYLQYHRMYWYLWSIYTMIL
jgi:hypothetical protein